MIQLKNRPFAGKAPTTTQQAEFSIGWRLSLIHIFAAISSVRTALGHEFGPAEADQPVSSLSCPGKYADVVNKHEMCIRDRTCTVPSSIRKWLGRASRYMRGTTGQLFRKARPLSGFAMKSSWLRCRRYGNGQERQCLSIA